MLSIGDIVERKCPDTLGNGSIGEIIGIQNVVYIVRILEGKNGMQGWIGDAWHKDWCIPAPLGEPDWEV